MDSQKLTRAKNLLFVALCADSIVGFIAIMICFFSVGKLKDISAGRISANTDFLSKMDALNNFANLGILTMIVVGIFLVRWLRACYVYAREVIGASGFKNESWTTSGWIIPFFNVFKPYQVLKEIYKAGTPNYELPEGWIKENGSFLLLGWWVFWVITHIIFVTSKKMLINTEPSAMTMRHVIRMLEIAGMLEFLSLVIAVLWFIVAESLTQRLLDQKKEVVILGRTLPETIAKSHNNKSSPTQVKESTLSGFNEEQAYRTIADEIDSSSMDKGLWLKAMIECGGSDKTQQTISYTELRLKQLRSDFIAGKTKPIEQKISQIIDKIDSTELINKKITFSPAVPLENVSNQFKEIKVKSSGKKLTNLVFVIAVSIVFLGFFIGFNNLSDKNVTLKVNDKAANNSDYSVVKRDYIGNQPEKAKSGASSQEQFLNSDKAVIPISQPISPDYLAHKSIILTDGFTTGNKIHMLGGSNSKKPYVGFILNIKTKLEDSLILSGNYDAAFQLYLELDGKGDSTASHNIGLMYIRGMGVKKDIEAGLIYLKRSMEDLPNYATSEAYYNKAVKELSIKNKVQ